MEVSRWGPFVQQTLPGSDRVKVRQGRSSWQGNDETFAANIGDGNVREPLIVGQAHR